MQTSRTDLPRDTVLDWACDLYDNAVDRKDAAGFAAAFAPNARLRFANADPVVGRDAIQSAIAQFFTAIAALKHEPRGAWLDGDTLFLEAVVTYTRHDRRQVSVPAVTIFRLTSAEHPDGPRPVAEECRIYVDLAPVFAPVA